MKLDNIYQRAIDYGELRHLVIDNSVLVEEVAAETIARLLKIDLNTSKSLGNSSGSLNFIQKVLMLKDLIGLDSKISSKITAFAEIRNKFAHVKAISNWKSFNDISDHYSRIIRRLEKWYPKPYIEQFNFEEKNTIFYTDLTLEVISRFMKISFDWAKEIGEKTAYDDIRKIAFDALKDADNHITVSVLWDVIFKKLEDNKGKNLKGLK